jgi:hypothetical protein
MRMDLSIGGDTPIFSEIAADPDFLLGGTDLRTPGGNATRMAEDCGYCYAKSPGFLRPRRALSIGQTRGGSQIRRCLTAAQKERASVSTRPHHRRAGLVGLCAAQALKSVPLDATLINRHTPVYEYEPGAWGPAEMDRRIVRADGWHDRVVTKPAVGTGLHAA